MIFTEKKDIQNRYSRQTLFSPIGFEGQKRLLESRVAVIGVGALGSVSANCLARAGVGFLRLVDRDFVELSNLQRQILFDEDDAIKNLPKVFAAENKLKRINSGIFFEAIFEDVDYTNIMEFIEDVDLVIDATDNMETRFLLNEACVRLEKPWIHGACVSSLGVTLSIVPGVTPCFLCFQGDMPQPGSVENCDTAGIIAPAVNVVASVQSAEALKILTGNLEAVQREAVYYDLWDNSFSPLSIVRNEECRVCGKREFTMLGGGNYQDSNVLCGQDAVQVMPAVKGELSLEALEKKLKPLGRVSGNGYFLKFSVEDYELIFFPDGRAIIKGTKDKKLARSLYARFIGI